MNILPLDETPCEFEVTSEHTGKGIGLFITVTSAHTKSVSDLLKSRIILKQRQSEFQLVGYDGDSAAVQLDELELEILSATGRIVDWRGIIEPCTRDNALILCSTNPFIRHQILTMSNDISVRLEEFIATLIEYAINELTLSAKQKDGSSLRETLESLYRNHNISDPLLIPIKVSPCVTYLWEHFLALNATRSSGMSVSAINYMELKAYCDMNSIQLSPFEVRVIKSLDKVFLDHYNKQSEKESSTK